MNKNREMQGIKQLLRIQLILSLLGYLLGAWFYNPVVASSMLLGGLVAVIPSWLFAKKLFHYRGAKAARQIVKGFYTGEFLKITSSMLLFALVFSLAKINPLVFFLTYIVMLMMNWFTPLFVVNKQLSSRSE